MAGFEVKHRIEAATRSSSNERPRRGTGQETSIQLARVARTGTDRDAGTWQPFLSWRGSRRRPVYGTAVPHGGGPWRACFRVPCLSAAWLPQTPAASCGRARASSMPPRLYVARARNYAMCENIEAQVVALTPARTSAYLDAAVKKGLAPHCKIRAKRPPQAGTSGARFLSLIGRLVSAAEPRIHRPWPLQSSTTQISKYPPSHGLYGGS